MTIQLTAFEIAMALLAACLSLVAGAVIIGVFVLAERNRFERYERLRGILLDICNPQGAQAVKLLAVHELRNYREYAGVIARALEKPAQPQTLASRAPAQQASVQQAPVPQAVKTPVSKPQPIKVPPKLQIVPPPAAPVQPQLAPFPTVTRGATKAAKLAVVETPKRDIMDGVIIRERGRPVKASVLREFLRFRDAVTDRLIYRNY